MFLLVVLSIHAQALEPPQTPETSPPVSVARIRRELEKEREFDIAATVGESTGPVFRVYINESLPPADRVWTVESVTPLYVRTQRPLYHHEFLAKVTPDEFRAGMLYPIGIDLVAVADLAVSGIRKALRSGAEARARSVVQKELASLLEARRAAGEKDR